MAIKKINSKEFWRLYGIFIGIVFFLIGTLIGFIKLSEKRNISQLKKSVQIVLDEKYENEWNVIDNIEIKNPFYLNSASYYIQNKENGEKRIAVILRVPTFYGPFPGVFIYKKGDEDAEFAGFSNVHGRIRTLLEQRKSDISINYWCTRIDDILRDSFIDE